MTFKWVSLALIACIFLGATSKAAEVVRLVTWNLEWFPGKKPAASQEERDKPFWGGMMMPQNDWQSCFQDFPFMLQADLKTASRGRLVNNRLQSCLVSQLMELGLSHGRRGLANAPRCYAYAKLEISGKPLHVYGLHLKSNLGDPVKNTSKREDAMEHAY